MGLWLYIYMYWDDCHVILVRLHSVKSQFHPLSHNFLINVALGLPSSAGRISISCIRPATSSGLRGFSSFDVNYCQLWLLTEVLWYVPCVLKLRMKNVREDEWCLCKYNGMQYHDIPTSSHPPNKHRHSMVLNLWFHFLLPSGKLT